MAGRIATMRLPVQKGQKHVKAKIRQESVRHLAFIRGLPKMTIAEAVAVAARVQRSRNPLRAATLVSTREILAMTEVLLACDERLQETTGENRS